MRFYFGTLGFPVESQMVEHVAPIQGQPARMAWLVGRGRRRRQARCAHAWLIEDMSDGRMRILTQETQNGGPGKALAKAVPNPMINGHQNWLNGLVVAARAAKG